MQLTELETKIMKVLWSLDGTASVNQILEHWTEGDVPGYTTVLKTLQIMEGKGHVRHRRKGKAYQYIARTQRGATARRLLGSVLGDFFSGDRVQMVNALIDGKTMTVAELDELRTLIDEKKREAEDGGSIETGR